MADQMLQQLQRADQLHQNYGAFVSTTICSYKRNLLRAL